jgi:hypothetical protein
MTTSPKRDLMSPESGKVLNENDEVKSKIDSEGNTKVTQGTGLDPINDAVKAYADGYNYRYISTATTTAVKDAPGYVKGILVGTTAAGTITVNDGSNTVAVLKSSIAEGFYPIEAYFATDIEVVTAAASKITVIYR